MGKLGLALVAATLATGGVACLVPSFDDMGGDDAKPAPSPRDNESAADATTTGSSSSSSSGGSSSGASSSSGGASAPTDAGSDAKAPTFACGSSGLRCAIGVQTCCGVYASVEPVCRPAATNPSECAGTLPCGDSADCGSGKVCCYRGNVANPGNGTCESSCSAPNTGTYAYRICDPQKPTCPGGSLCNGRFWGLAYCI